MKNKSNKDKLELTNGVAKKHQEVIIRAKASARKFNKELRKSTLVAIVGAFSLLIALAWKDVITQNMSSAVID